MSSERPAVVATHQIDFLTADHNERRGGTVAQVERHQAIVDPPHDPRGRALGEFGEPDDQAAAHHSDSAVRHRSAGRGDIARKLGPQRARQPSVRVEDLDAHEHPVVGHQRIAGHGGREVEALELAGALPFPAGAPQERPLRVVAPELRSAPVRDHDAAVAQARRGDDVGELVLGGPGHGADLDEGRRVHCPAFAGAPDRGHGGGDLDAGRVGVHGVHDVGGGFAGGGCDEDPRRGRAGRSGAPHRGHRGIGRAGVHGAPAASSSAPSTARSPSTSALSAADISASWADATA